MTSARALLLLLASSHLVPQDESLLRFQRQLDLAFAELDQQQLEEDEEETEESFYRTWPGTPEALARMFSKERSSETTAPVRSAALTTQLEATSPGAQAIRAVEAARDSIAREAVRLLDCEDGPSVAWGAYLAGRHGLVELNNAVMTQLARWVEANGIDAPLVRACIIDALVRLGASATVDQLGSLADQGAVGPLLLLMRNSEANRDYLLERFLSWESNAQWLVVGHALLRQREPRAVPRIVREVEYRLRLVILTQSGTYDAGGRVGLDGSAGRVNPDGSKIEYPQWEKFPPLTQFKLVRAARIEPAESAVHERSVFPLPSQPDHLVVAAPVRRRGFYTEPVSRRLSTAAQSLLDRCAGRSVTTTFDEAVFVRSPEDFLAAVEAHRDIVRAAHARLLVELSEDNWLTREQAADLPPNLRVQVSDRRAGRTFPLPALPDAIRPRDRRSRR